MQEPPRYTVDPQRVAHETIDGETIVIDFAQGTYHSLAGAGSEIWGHLVAGWTVAEITTELERRHGDGHGVDTAVRELVDRVRTAGLLDPADPATAPSPRLAPPTPVDGEPEPFVAPVMQTYDDMEYLLLLDPIHEAEAAGWPERAA